MDCHPVRCLLQLLADVHSQRMEFVKALESRILQIEQEQGKISGRCVHVCVCSTKCICIFANSSEEEASPV